MKKILIIFLTIIILRVFIFFINQSADNIITYKNIEIQNSSGTGVKIETINEKNINKTFLLNSGEIYTLNLGTNDSNSVNNFLLLGKNYNDELSKIVEKMRKNDIYTDDKFEIRFNNQEIVISKIYFPFYTRIINNYQKYIIIIKN